MSTIIEGGGIQNVSITILDTSGDPDTSLTHLSDIVITYIRSDEAVNTIITLVAGSSGIVIDSGFVHLGSGIYQLGLPAAATLSGESVLIQWSGDDVTDDEEVFEYGDTSGSLPSGISNKLIKLRYLIGDLDPTNYTYTDARLTQLIMVAACYVKTDISADYVVDLTGCTITPDPSEDVCNLIVMRAACLLTKSEQKTGAGTGIRVTDGPTTIDYKGVSSNLAANTQTFCEDYYRALMKYLAGGSLNSGGPCIVSTPNNSNF